MKLLLIGATGQMGKVVSDLVSQTEHTIVAGVAEGSTTDAPFPIYQNAADVSEAYDVIIDFSSPEMLDSLLALKKPIVIASTGHDDENISKIKAASEQTPILFSGNLSLGVNVMELVVEKLSNLLSDFDIEIIEKHHRYKKDAPSGTAKMLFAAANKGRGNELEEVEGRSGMTYGRDSKEVGVSSIRGGTIVGEHSVIFAGEDESVEIKHMASSKKIFATGALKAAAFLLTQEAGLFDMNEVLDG